MKLNFENLYEEFLKGRKLCPIMEDKLDNEKRIRFFISVAHRIAFDEGYYNLFEKAYPNFFEYIKHEDEFVKRILG